MKQNWNKSPRAGNYMADIMDEYRNNTGIICFNCKNLRCKRLAGKEIKILDRFISETYKNTEARIKPLKAGRYYKENNELFAVWCRKNNLPRSPYFFAGNEFDETCLRKVSLYGLKNCEEYE